MIPGRSGNVLAMIGAGLIIAVLLVLYVFPT